MLVDYDVWLCSWERESLYPKQNCCDTTAHLQPSKDVWEYTHFIIIIPLIHRLPGPFATVLPSVQRLMFLCIQERVKLLGHLNITPQCVQTSSLQRLMTTSGGGLSFWDTYKAMVCVDDIHTHRSLISVPEAHPLDVWKSFWTAVDFDVRVREG